jgi:hypothetical protein
VSIAIECPISFNLSLAAEAFFVDNDKLKLIGHENKLKTAKSEQRTEHFRGLE